MGLLSTLGDGADILFGKDSSTTTGTDTTTTSSLEELFNQLTTATQDSSMSKEERSQQMQSILGEINNTMQTSTTTLAEEEQELARKNLDLISSTMNDAIASDFSPEKAAELSKSARDGAINQVLRSGMSGIADLGTNAGAYDSTVQGRAGAELGAIAAEKGSAAELEMQKSFGALDNQKTSNMIGAMDSLLNIMKGAETSQQQSSQQQSSSTSETDTSVTGSSSSKTKSTTDTTSSSSKDSSSTSSVSQLVEEDEEGLLGQIGGFFGF